jgi:hypothetical protein
VSSKPKRAAFRSSCETALQRLGFAINSKKQPTVDKPLDTVAAKRTRSSTTKNPRQKLLRQSFMCAHCALASPPRSLVFDKADTLVAHVRDKHMEKA